MARRKTKAHPVYEDPRRGVSPMGMPLLEGRIRQNVVRCFGAMRTECDFCASALYYILCDSPKQSQPYMGAESEYCGVYYEEKCYRRVVTSLS